MRPKLEVSIRVHCIYLSIFYVPSKPRMHGWTLNILTACPEAREPAQVPEICIQWLIMKISPYIPSRNTKNPTVTPLITGLQHIGSAVYRLE